MADEKQIDVEELKGEIDALKAKNRELIAELRKARGTTNEEAARLASELEELRAENAKLNTALKKAAESTLNLQKEYEEQLKTKSSALQRLVRDEGLVKALTSEKVRSEFLPAVVALLRDKVEVDEEKLEAFVADGGIRKPLDQFVKEWAASDMGKNFITAPLSSGGGALGAGRESVQTKAWKDMNIDEQTTLFRTNPELARRLMATG